ncbi:porin [Pseudaminobacter soli (ex Li et al. 2025)]|uniref:Porin n=1 Tax=Pseudaminobacter soli (ex Li et al. 2025) TaxID=1295366 RepID=A0A2P7RZI0_9HYPH|nr:porin [Mesorhizobium soli]PSJ55645.1 porin [Mesorhizobium soli]
MNIKSLLLGSAAALVAVSGARAADAVVVAEPEPVEYVRICDVYGAGFYYIPGTETCLKVGGYVRFEMGVGKGPYGGRLDLLDREDFIKNHEDGDKHDKEISTKTRDSYRLRARYALQMDARSETELGTLRAYTQINFDWNNPRHELVREWTDDQDVTHTQNIGGALASTNDMGINHAFIELGGFRVGKTDSLYATMTGYAGGVIADDLIPYANYDTHQVAYTYTGANGFSAAISLEEGNDGAYGFTGFNPFNDNALEVGDGINETLDSYAPHVIAGAAWTQAWGGISGVVGYDAVYQEWGGKVRVDWNATDALSLWAMVGGGSLRDRNKFGFDPSTNVPVTRNWVKPWGGKWAVWGGGTYKFNPKASGNLQVSWSQNKDVAVAANVAYELVPGFVITPEVNYLQIHDDITKEKIRNEWAGILRFQRSF